MSPILRNSSRFQRPADIDRLVRVLSDGGVAIAPTDTVYGLIGKAFDRRVFEKMDAIKGERRLPYAAIFSDLDSIEEWVGGLSFRRRRLISSLLPGPLTFILNSSGKLPLDFRYRSSGIGVRFSSDALLPKLAHQLNSPIWATSANRSNDPAPADFRSVNHNLLKEVDIAVDAGPTIFNDPSTVVDLRTNSYSILREGPWLERVRKAIARSMEPLEVLVVCTGNICRSPIAAYLLKKHDIPFLNTSSAGLNALPNQPATTFMQTIATEWNIDLGAHRSMQLTPEILRSTDLILAATEEHRERIVRMAASAKHKTFLLADSIGETDIPDPYGHDENVYQDIAELIRKAVDGWAERIRKFVLDEFTIQTNAGESR